MMPDVVATAGVTLMLLAFVLNLAGRVQANGAVYLWLNLFGGALACAASIMIGYVPFVVLEGAWTLAALAGITRMYAPTAFRRR
jgi:hypothetical protein